MKNKSVCPFIAFMFLLFTFLHANLFGQAGFSEQVETVVQTGHNHWIRGINLSRDNKYLISWSNDKTTIIWDIATHRQIRKFAGHKEIVIRGDLSANNQYLVTRDFKNVLILWEAATGKVFRQIEALDFVLSFDGTKLYYTSPDYKVNCLSFSNPDLIQTSKLPFLSGYFLNEMQFVAFDTYGAKLIDLETGNVIRKFDQGGSQFLISGDKKYYITGKNENYQVYNYETGQSLFTLSGDGKEISNLVIHPSKTWVSGMDGGVIYVWDYTNGNLIKKIDAPAYDIAFSKDGKYLVNAYNDIFFTNLNNWKITKEFKKYSFAPTCLAFNPEGNMLATGYRTGQLKIWDLNRIKVFHHIEAGPVKNGDIQALVFTPDGNTLITGGREQKLKFWDVKTGAEKFSLTFSSSIDKIAISPDGKTIACARGSFKGGAFVMFMPSWNQKTEEELRKEKEEKLDQYAISVVDISSEPKLLYSLKGHEAEVRDLKFSPDGSWLVSGSTDYIILWDAKNGTIVNQLKNPDSGGWISTVEFDKTGQKFITGSLNGEIRIWDRISGTILNKWQAHTGSTDGDIVGLSLNGNELISSSFDHTIKFWDIASGRLLNTLSKSYGGFYRMTKSLDGNWLATAAIGGQVSLWDLKTKNEKLILAAIGDDDFVATTSEGYYTASPEAGKGVHFVKGMKIYTFDNFDVLFNRPDKVLKILGIADQSLIDAYYRAWKKRLAKLGFAEDQLNADLHLPEVIILDEIPFETSQNRLTFNVSLSDSKYLLNRINVYVNNVPVYGIKGDNFGFMNKQELKKTVNIQLNSGRNFVQVSAHNDKGIESLKQSFEIVNTNVHESQLYVVCIGVSDYLLYDASNGDLQYAAKDALDFGKLIDQQSTVFTSKKNISLTNSEATRTNILNIKNELLTSTVDDGVIVFFAGHGLLDQQMDYYLATSNINFDNPSANGLAYDELESLMDGIPARKKLLLIDACNSGEVDKQETVFLAAAAGSHEPNITTRGFKSVGGNIGLFNSFELMQQLFGNIQKGTGAVVISSASGVEVAFESNEWKNGAFTYTMLNGLRTGSTDKNQDGAISVAEIRDYVIENVEKLTGGKQHPTTRKGNLEFDFNLINTK